MKKRNRDLYTFWTRGFGIILLLLLIFLTLLGCRPDYSPKPDGFFRIDQSDSSYITIDHILPITFDISKSARILSDSAQNEPFWINIVYPHYKATLYCSYFTLNPGNKVQLFAESKELIYRHSTQAENISASSYENTDKGIYATLYTLSGNSATPLQFTVTDSLSFLLRGALYYDLPVRADSVAPVTEYITEDVIRLIESLQPLKDGSH